MAPRDIAAADPPAAEQPGVRIEDGSDDPIPIGQVLARGLVVLERLGSTPEGPLYRAAYPTGVEVALVVLRSEAGGVGRSSRERFGRAMQIRHPNVAAVYAVDEMEDGSAYAVLEQLSGEPLSNLLAAGRVFTLRKALDLVLQASAGLEAAHRAGFVHGNLSPHTILITEAAEGRSAVKLVGFNHDPAFRQGAVPSYPEAANAEHASPERLAGFPPDERSDVFSLGAVLHHLLTGVPPEAEQVAGSTPKAARALLKTALAPAPERRFQTAWELGEALKRAGAASPRRAVIHWGLLFALLAVCLDAVTGGTWLRRWTSEERPDPVHAPIDPPIAEPTSTPASVAPRAPAPARAPTPAAAAARGEAPSVRSGPAVSDASPVVASADSASGSTRTRADSDALADAPTARTGETPMAATPPPEEPSRVPLEKRADVYLRIGLDEASRLLGRPVHAIEGMTPSFLGMVRSQFPGYTTAGSAVRVVYVGPRGDLILLDQQRMRPGRPRPATTATRWHIGDVMLYLHGEAPPMVLRNLVRRVR